MYLNKAFIVGNITRDPELKAIASGQKVCTFSVATNRVWKDPNGGRKEATDYHNVVVWGRQAETSAQYLKKGSSVLIEGRLQTRSWDGQDGKKNYRTEIVADRVQFGNRGGGEGMGGAPSDGPNTRVYKKDDQPKPEMDTIEYPEEDSNPEDIPF